ncbi:MAG: B-box zinc finger protein [Promethearchaeota archaeon]
MSAEQVCRFCHRYVKLAYYCEECGSSCCSECLHEKKVDFYICQECKSKNVEISQSENKKICKDCGEENINKVNQRLKSCPKCDSHQIVNIYEKKEELEKNFLELIKNTRLFINPLKEILDKLYLFQNKIKEIRNPPNKYYHFPKMESDLLALFKLFLYIQNTLFEKINIYFHQLNQNKEYFFDIYTQPNSNITIIEGIYENLLRSYVAIEEFIKDNLKTFNDSFETFEKNLVFITKISQYFNEYKKLLRLAEGEKPVYAIFAKLTNGLNTQEKFKKDKGILFITNYDLSFVHEFGVVKKKKELIFKAPVRDLTKIREKGKIFKKLYIEFTYGKYEFTLPPKAVSRVIEYILLARSFDETTIYDERTAKKLQQIDIDLNELINFIEESINSFFSIKCQYNKNFDNLNKYNKDFNPVFSINPNQIQNFPSIKQPQFINSQNNDQFWFKEQSKSYPNYNNFHLTPNVYQRINTVPYLQPFQNQSPYFVGNLQPPNYNNHFFLQNARNQNRFQNYNPQRINSDNDLNNLLNPNHPNQANIINNINQNENDYFYNSDAMFQDYNRNHLSDLFDSQILVPSKPYRYKRKLFKLDKEKHQKMLELEKEKYSLKETLKKLDTKFDQGIISEVDYFKTFKNLQKEIYLIEKKIQDLQNNLQEVEEIRKNSRNFDKKRFYT